jgi:hypothetical protein
MPKPIKITLKPKNKKVIVFDLDETLGSFGELGSFCNILDEYYGDKQTSYKMLHDLLDLYPEFIRPQIINILKYILQKKKEDKCKYIMIYTNNQDRVWVEHIKGYFEKKLKSKIFEQVICAFKVDGQVLEINRTTQEKTVDDFFRCTKLPRDIEICFVDDLFHPKMEEDNVYYIHVKAYKHYIPTSALVDRFINSHLVKDVKNKEELRNFLTSKLKYNIQEKNKEEQEVDIIVSKKLLEHIKEFFNKDEKDTNNKEISSSLSPHHSHQSHPHSDISGKRKSFKRPKVISQRNRTLKKKLYYL